VVGIFWCGVEFLDDVEGFVTAALLEEPARGEGDEVRAQEHDEREEALERQWESPGERCMWRIGGKEETCEAEPAGETVSQRVCDASDADHGSSCLGGRHFSLIHWYHAGQHSCAPARDEASNEKHCEVDGAGTKGASDDEDHAADHH